jgi:hypothetical protein
VTDLALLKEDIHSNIFVQKDYYKEKMCISPASVSRLVAEDFSSGKTSPKEALSKKNYLDVVLEVTNLDFAFLSVDLLMFFIPFYRFFEMVRFLITVPTEYINSNNYRRQLEYHLLSYLDSPVEQRATYQSETVSKFSNLLRTVFFNACHEKEYDKNMFTIPVNQSLEQNFCELFGKLVVPETNVLPEKVKDTYWLLVQKCFQNSQSQKDKAAVIEEVKAHVRQYLVLVLYIESNAPCVLDDNGNMMSLLNYFMSDPYLNDPEMGEWLWVMYGSYAYHCFAENPRTNYLLLNICRHDIKWAFQMVVIASSKENLDMPINDEGDTIFHFLAKAGKLNYLAFLVNLGHFSEINNNNHENFFQYLQQNEYREKLENANNCLISYFHVPAESTLTEEEELTLFRKEIMDDERFHALPKIIQDSMTDAMSPEAGEKLYSKPEQTIMDMLPTADEEKARKAEEILLGITDRGKTERTNTKKQNKKKSI